MATSLPAQTAGDPDRRTLRGEDGVEAVFEVHERSWRWAAYRDIRAGVEWPISGPRFSLQTPDGRRTNLSDCGFASLTEGSEAGRPCILLQTALINPPVEVRQTFTFCKDGRTLRIRSALRTKGESVVIQRVGLLEIRLAGQNLRLMGPGNVSSPVFGDRIFAGVEHPSLLCQVDGDTMYLAQHSYPRLGADWVEQPAAVIGSVSEAELGMHGKEALRRAFLRYLDTVRIKPTDMHLHYNNWWTMPVPSSEKDVLANIAELKRGLHDRTGLFFDSYAMDMGWSDPHSVWEVNRGNYPEGFRRIRDALATVGGRPGLWVSPSSLYPPALDNEWLEKQGYEVCPGTAIGRFACLALGGKYQSALKQALLRHAREAHLGHVKFDGLMWPCDVATHGHPTGIESFQPIAEGLADIMDALRAEHPNLALEPTCLGYYPSPWWLMHVPFVIGPFGDDSPNGRCPCPEWIESMTTGREVANLKGRDAFLMPSSALQCFDIIVQCPGDFQNHAVMAIGRGRWFLSTYINPRFMDAGEWRFFADLIRWARANRDILQEPVPFGGDPADRRPYGYAYQSPARQLFFLRNPWIEETSLRLPSLPDLAALEVRTLYPRRQLLCRTATGASLPAVHLGPYELLVVEAVPTTKPPLETSDSPGPEVTWQPSLPATFERFVYEEQPPAYGPSWTCPDGDADHQTLFKGAGTVRTGTETSELCVLAEGGPEVGLARGIISVDGREVPVRMSQSTGSFSATGAKPEESWIWFMVPVPSGKHHVAFQVVLGGEVARCGVFLRGSQVVRSHALSFGPGPSFPLYRADRRPWCRVLVPMTQSTPEDTPPRRAQRNVERINGVYLDSLPWIEATAGWGEVHRNRSVMGKPMVMAGRPFHRGLGTHAYSRIVYAVPTGYRRFAATIACDQEVRSNSIVFVVMGDGRELFRSLMMRYDGPLVEANVPVDGVKQLALIVEDGGDGIGADHGDWANARLLK